MRSRDGLMRRGGVYQGRRIPDHRREGIGAAGARQPSGSAPFQWRRRRASQSTGSQWRDAEAGAKRELENTRRASAKQREGAEHRERGGPARRTSMEGGDAGFDEVDDVGCEVGAVELVDFLDAGRTGDVHFGEEVADDIEPDEVEAVALETRAQHLTDLAVARRD